MTNKQPTPEEMWEYVLKWARVEAQEETYTRGAHAGEYTGRLLYPPLALDNLFKWVVPKAIGIIQDRDILLYQAARYKLFERWLFTLMSVEEDNYELALLQAVWEVIHE